jgi:hypothetical protein
MNRVLMVNGITDAFGTCESRRFAEGRCAPMVERAIRGRVDPRLWLELALDPDLDFS